MSRPEPSLIMQEEGMGTQMGADDLEELHGEECFCPLAMDCDMNQQ